MSTLDPSVHLDYRGLKAAAIRMAGMPECVQRAIIREHNAHSTSDTMSGLFLLMRVLFVLPSDRRGGMYSSSYWQQPVWEAAKKTKTWDYQWPVHVHPQGSVLEIDRCPNTGSSGYHVMMEFHEWTTNLHFPTRTPAEIEALEIREAP